MWSLLVLAACASAQETLVCTVLNSKEVQCGNDTYSRELRDLPGSPKFYFDLVLCVALVLFAGTMSGLTIGLLSMDLTSLSVLKHGGEPNERIYASRIIPLVEHKHLLLVTLLLCNAAAMEALPIFLDEMVPSYMAIIISVTDVLFFGEIIPQAICSRYGLAIGYYLSIPVSILMLLMCVIAWPISKILDYILGEDHPTLYARSELKELIYLHGQPRPDPEEQLTHDEMTIIRGVLDMAFKRVEGSMVPLSAVYSLPVDAVIDDALLNEIMHEGYSRIPIYKGGKDCIVGAVLVKRLLLIDPRDHVPIRDVMRYSLPVVSSTYPLFSMLNDFQKGDFHMAIVKDAEEGTVQGIITLEDVIEELIAEEIVDETDLYVDVQRRVHVVRKRTDLTRRVVQAPPPSLRPLSKAAHSGSYGSSSNMLEPPVVTVHVPAAQETTPLIGGQATNQNGTS